MLFEPVRILSLCTLQQHDYIGKKRINIYIYMIQTLYITTRENKLIGRGLPSEAGYMY